MNNIYKNANSNPKRGASIGAGRLLFWLSLTAIGLIPISCAMPLSGAAPPFLYVILLAIAIAGYSACSSSGGSSDSGGSEEDNGNQTPTDNNGNPTPVGNNGNQTPTPTPMPTESEGALDLFVANDSQEDRVYINASTADNVAFTASDAAGSRYSSRGVALEDLDNDGDLDAFVANYVEDNQVYLGDGTGSFSDPSDLPGGDTYSRAVALGDLDGDGELDAFVANTDGANQVYLGDGTGSFSDPSDLPGRNSRAVALDDLDKDGHLDAVVANYGKANQVYLGDGTGSFSAPTNLPGGAKSSTGVALGDLDGDGDLDAFVVNYYGDDGTFVAGANQVYLGDGAGSFGDPIDLPGESRTSQGVAIGDLDGQ